MEKENRVVSPESLESDVTTDINLRPKQLVDYLGQTKVKEKIGIIIEAANQRNDVLDHVLLYGLPYLYPYHYP